MWTTLAFVAALVGSPLQAGELALSNPRFTWGTFGPERTEVKILPGDSLYLSFDIEGLKVDPSGKATYTLGMEVVNNKGKVQYGQEAKAYERFLSLGGNKIPAVTYVNTGVNQEPGEYTINVTVTDTGTKAAQKLTRKFEVLPRDFGLVGLEMFNLRGDAAPFGGLTGQVLVVSFGAVGFERDKAKKQPSLSVEMRVLDESGKPTFAKPWTGEVLEAPADATGTPMQYHMDLNRAGKFTVEVTATDKVSKKTAKLSFPLTVTDRK